MRCSYNLCGTETFRLASSSNAFGRGTNLQNLPKGTKAKEVDELSLPNIRSMFVPDPDFIFFDGDLDRADLQVVVWEADDRDLKLALRMGLDLHCFNACAIFGIRNIPLDELAESHPNYPEHRRRIGYEKRQKAKQGVHATNYGCKSRTLSTHLGSTVHEADRFIQSWLSAHPGIARWHERVERDLRNKRKVRNAYGYERVYFDRVESLLPEALAWIPQSTVALTINRIWRRIWDEAPQVQVLLQVHDSLAGQFPVGCSGKQTIESIARTVVIPYEDPLTIPFSVKTSEKSWGECA
jgi:DNA polymerase-1